MKKILPSLLIAALFSVTSYGQNNSARIPGCSYPGAPALTPNGSGSLGQSYVLQNVCGLNYVTTTLLTETRSISAGFNTTGTGFPCTLAIAGIPACATILQAYAYWSAEYTETTAPSTSIVLTNPAAATSTTAATTIGTGPYTYWGNTGTSCYRADITSDIAGNGNYKVNLTGFANAAWEVDGVTIIIVYSNTTATYSGSISLWDGCMVNSTTNANIGPETFTGFTACAASTTNSAFVLLGDCQTGITGNGNEVTNDQNGTTASFPPAFWQLNVSNNTTITNGQTSLVDNTYTNNVGGDAFVWEMAGLYWQNTSCVVCNSFTATIASTNPNCGSSNGTATATPSGGNSPYTYAWTPSGQTTATATGLSAGNYTVTVSDGCASTTATVTLTSGTLGVTASTTANEPCNGNCVGAATSTTTGGTPPYTYAWTPSGGINPNASALCAGTYTITVQDASGGCSVTATAVITQPPLLGINTVPDNILCFGETGSATATATGGTVPYTYGWETAPPQLSATATGLSAGTYSVGVEDNNGCTATNTVVITQPATPVAVTATMTPALCSNSNGTATASVSGGTSPYTYTWAPVGGNADSATGLSADTYTVTVKDNNACTTTFAIVVTSVGGPDITITSQTNELCNGGNNGAAYTSTTGGTTPYTYSWAGVAGTTPNAVGISAGTYTVTVKDNNGCSSSADVVITQPAALGTTTSFTQASCNLFNGSATVTVTGGTSPYNYLWEPSAQTTPTAAGISAGSYTVGIEDNNGCTVSAVVDVTQPSAVVVSIGAITNVSCFVGDNGTIGTVVTGGTAPFGYEWAPSGGDGATGTGFAAGCYTVTAHDANGCTSTAAACITQPALLTATINGPSVICAGTTGTLTANVNGGTQPYNYTWSGVGIASATSTASVTPTSTQTYTVNVTDANGCTTSAQFTINFGPPMTVSIVGPTSICPNQVANLCSVITGGTGGNSFSWSSSTGDTYSTPCISVSPVQTTTYTLSVLDNCGVTQTAQTTIQINPYPVVNFAADLYQGCAPLCVQFYNTTTIAGGTAQSYSWLFGDGDSSQIGQPIYCYPDSGLFNVSLTVTSDSGCSATLKKVNMIKVFTHPIAAFTMSPQPATILNPTIQFTNQSSDAYPIIYSFWSFGDATDSTSMLQNPEHTYLDTGSYCAQLIVVDEHGCTDTTTNCLVIDPVFDIYIPSAFTPNGNGLNETFTAKGEYIKSFSMDIFDRWGEHLYHTDNINAGWNGTVNGGSTVSQEDVYVYKILATDVENQQHSYIGSVTLIK